MEVKCYIHLVVQAQLGGIITKLYSACCVVAVVWHISLSCYRLPRCGKEVIVYRCSRLSGTLVRCCKHGIFKLLRNHREVESNQKTDKCVLVCNYSIEGLPLMERKSIDFFTGPLRQI